MRSVQQPEEEKALDQQVKPHKHMRMLQFDNKYIIPVITNLTHVPEKSDSSYHGEGTTSRKSFSLDGPEDDDHEGDEVIEVVRRDVSVN